MRIEGSDVKFDVHPRFSGIVDYVLWINSFFSKLPYIIQNGRNDIRVDNIQEHRLVIKSFKGMYWPNRLAYSLFRKSKARRSFETSLRLQKMSYSVPMPVAYADYYRFGMLRSSYFISLYQAHEDLQTAISKYSRSHDVLKLFAAFTFQIHRSGICHEDYSKGNILCVFDGDEVRFSMVDLNRVKFRRMDYHAGLRSLSKLGLPQSDFEEVVGAYAQLWGSSLSDATQYIARIQRSRSRLHRIKQFLKRIFFPARVQRSAGKPV